jgi:branched-chain amino acid transport system substrate-binding protein
MIKKKFWILQAILITGIFPMILLSNSSENLVLAKDAILIGGTISETGTFNTDVGVFRKLMETWATMINEKGGLPVAGQKLPVKFILYDDKSDRDAALKFYEKLVTEDKADLLIGPYSSFLTLAASTVAEKHGIPFVAVEANSPKIYERGYKWIVGVLASATIWSDHYFDMTKAERKAKTIAFIAEDIVHGREVYEGAIKKAEEIGLQVVFKEIAPSKTVDFGAPIAKMKGLNPDIVYISAFHPFAVAFMKQAKELDLNPREFHPIHHAIGFQGALGKDAEYAVGETYWVPGIQKGDTQLFEELLKRSNIDPGQWPWAGIRMGAFDAIKGGIEKAGTLDRAKLMEALKTLSTETITGTLRFDEKGVGTMNTIPTQIQDGKYVLVWPKTEGMPAGEHRYPTPPWSERK